MHSPLAEYVKDKMTKEDRIVLVGEFKKTLRNFGRVMNEIEMEMAEAFDDGDIEEDYEDGEGR